MRHLRTHHRLTDGGAGLGHSRNAPQLSLSDEQIRAVYRFMYQRVGNRSDAESLTERACSEALRDGSSLADEHDEQSLDDLLWQVAYRVVSEHLGWFYGSPVAPAGSTSSDEYSDAGTQVREILERLSAQERAFLSHRFLANAALDEAAAALDMTRSDALAMQWRALLQAGRILQPETTCSTC